MSRETARRDAFRREYEKCLRGMLDELYCEAHAACGNSDLADAALQRAISRVYAQRLDTTLAGVRSELRHAVREEAEDAREREADAECDFVGLSADSDDPALLAVASAPIDVQRMAVLRYGFSMGARQIAALLACGAGEVDEALRALCDRAELGEEPERVLRERMRGYVCRKGAASFDPGGVMRAFARQADATRAPRAPVRALVRATLGTAAVALCALLFWLMAVLIAE